MRGLLSHTELAELVANGVIDAPLENINPASIEVTLGNRFYIEKPQPWIVTKDTKAIELFTDLANKQNISLELVELKDGEMLVLKPGQVALAETVETFNLPNNITAEYVLKSSQARNFWAHQLAGFCDCGWHNSKLTMEFKNDSEHGYLALTPGQKCGQMKFVMVTEVPEDKSYAVVGQYNHQTEVTASKGIR